MPDFLRAHVRYPEFLFRVQAAIYATYHVENEQVFYNREDIWTVAQQGRASRDRNCQTPSSLLRPDPFSPVNPNWNSSRSCRSLLQIATT